jgi:hypothetical protein
MTLLLPVFSGYCCSTCRSLLILLRSHCPRPYRPLLALALRLDHVTTIGRATSPGLWSGDGGFGFCSSMRGGTDLVAASPSRRVRGCGCGDGYLHEESRGGVRGLRPRGSELRSTKMPRVPALPRRPLRSECAAYRGKGSAGAGSSAEPVLDGEQSSFP